MAVEKVRKEAFTPAEVQEAGFIGVTNSYPNEFHEASGEAEALRAELTGITAATHVVAEPTGATDKGAVVNGPAKNSPKPPGGTSGPGASTDTSNDDK
jgi:hypothetical protein